MIIDTEFTIQKQNYSNSSSVLVIKFSSFENKIEILRIIGELALYVEERRVGLGWGEWVLHTSTSPVFLKNEYNKLRATIRSGFCSAFHNLIA
jgi:hypothetical protein